LDFIVAPRSEDLAVVDKLHFLGSTIRVANVRLHAAQNALQAKSLLADFGVALGANDASLFRVAALKENQATNMERKQRWNY
jgi:hypothetical protein